MNDETTTSDKQERDVNSSSSNLKLRIKDYAIEAAKSTTTHGIDRFALTKRPFLKVFWAILFLSSTAACAFFIANNVLSYLQYDVVTQIEIVYEEPQLFPTVSFCTANIINSPAKIEFARKVFAQNGINNPLQNIEKFGEQLGINISLSQVNLLGRFLIGANFYGLNMSAEEIKNLTTSYDEFILDCSFNFQPCNSSMFESYFSINYGSCFKFNYAHMKPGPFYTYRTGAFNSLRVELFTPDLTDPYSFATTSGVYVIVQNASETTLNSVGVAAQTATETNIQVERQFISKLEKPYSDCVKNLAAYGSDLYELMIKMGKTYQQRDCFDLCYQTYLIQECGCIDQAFYALPGQRFCTNLTEIACDFKFFLGFYSERVKKECTPKCPLECDSQHFRLTVSSSLFPTKAYASQLANSTRVVEASKLAAKNLSELSYDELKHYFLGVNVYYADMQYVTISEVQKTSFIDLVSGVGGTLGLFLGMSFMSFFEAVDVLIEAFFLVYEDKWSRKRKVFVAKSESSFIND